MMEDLHALYLHIPFCLKKCSYCDFYSLALMDFETMRFYSQRMAELIQIWGESFENTFLDTIYFGGGTPSLLSERMVGDILEAIYRYWKVVDQPEISLEINPATLGLGKMRSFYQSGINRISLGVQSFVPEELKTLGRVHGEKEVFETVDRIKQAGFSNFNIDLIYGIPGQTIKNWDFSSKQAINCKPDHLSMYLLQLDSSVPLYRWIKQGEKTELDEDMMVEMFYYGIQMLEEQGYKHYEISNFALNGKECQHNLHYWHSHPYLGLGASAVSFLKNSRFRLSPNIDSFLNWDSTPEQGLGEILETMDTLEEKLSDAMIMGLRCIEGVSENEMKKRFAVDITSYYKKEFLECEKIGLLEHSEGFWRFTKKGWFLSNQVLWRFL